MSSNNNAKRIVGIVISFVLAFNTFSFNISMIMNLSGNSADVARRSTVGLVFGVIIMAICIYNGIRLISKKNTKKGNNLKLSDNNEKTVKLINKTKQPEKLLEIARGASVDTAKLAIKKMADTDQKALGKFLCDRYLNQSKKEYAFSLLTDEAEFIKVAESGADDVSISAVKKIDDRKALEAIAKGERARVCTRVAAYEKLGSKKDADILRVMNNFERSSALNRILDYKDTDLIRKVAQKLLQGKPAPDSKFFILAAANTYPDIIRNMWSSIRTWTHEDVSKHIDKTDAPHVDRTEYYDFFRYPDGRTVPNKSGRRKHTDTHLPSSDCTTYSHSDTRHTDSKDDAFLSGFPAKIRENK